MGQVPTNTASGIPGTRPIYDHQSWENNNGQVGTHQGRISSRCGIIRSKSKQIPSSGFVVDKDMISENYFDVEANMCFPCEVIRPLKSMGSLKESIVQIPTSGSGLDSMREIKEKKKRNFVVKKHKVGDKIELGMLVDSGADAHMVPEGMFDLPINTEKAHGFETADGTEMLSPGTQYIPGYMGPNFDIPFTVECFVADVDRIILSPGLLRKKGVSFAMEPERSFIKLQNGAEVNLLNDDKETVFLEAKLSPSHPAFKPDQDQELMKKDESRKRKKKGGKTFRRQGTKR